MKDLDVAFAPNESEGFLFFIIPTWFYWWCFLISSTDMLLALLLVLLLDFWVLDIIAAILFDDEW